MYISELRFGNTIEHKYFGWVEVRSIKLADDPKNPENKILTSLSSSYENVLHYSPIKLNKEIFNYLYFKSLEKNNNYSLSDGIIDAYWKEIDGEFFWIVEDVNGLYLGYEVDMLIGKVYHTKPFHYLHQLQNLFFSVWQQEVR